MDEFDLDRATEVGWAGFLNRLAGHLIALAEPLRITPYGADDTDEGIFPVLTVEADEDHLRAQLHTPGGRPWPEDSRRERMLSLGWSEEPGKATYLLRMPRSHAHLLAATLTDTLRQVVGAPHPAFLDAGALSISAPAGPDQASAEMDSVPDIDLDTAIKVTSPAELRQAVRSTLHAAMGHPPRHDADGDIPIIFGTTLVYVRTADSQAVVSIFAVVVQDIADLDAARREVGILNRQSVFAKFHLVADQVIASVAIPCLPFVPRHLVGMVELMGKELDRLDDALALRVRGRRWIDLMTGADAPTEQEAQGAINPPYDPGGYSGGQGSGGAREGQRGEGGQKAQDDLAPATRHTANVDVTDDEGGDEEEDAELPDELLTLLQLDADGQGGLEPALVADVCHHDRSLLLRLIRISEEQTIAWRQSVEEARAVGDAEEARVAGGELRGWDSTVRELRAALRHVVTFGGEEGRAG